jgi:hypothetical protein
MVSAEIETLQARSTSLSIRLENRKVVEHCLGPIVEEISVSPAVVKKVVEGVIDEAWVRALAEVGKRFKAMEAKSKELQKLKAVNDLKPLLENLINTVRFLCLVELSSTDFLIRLLKGSGTSSLLRSRLCGPQTSMLKSYSNSALLDIKTFSDFCIGITRSWQRRLAKPTSIRCDGTS